MSQKFLCDHGVPVTVRGCGICMVKENVELKAGLVAMTRDVIVVLDSMDQGNLTWTVGPLNPQPVVEALNRLRTYRDRIIRGRDASESRNG